MSELKNVHCQIAKDFWMKVQLSSSHSWREYMEAGICLLEGLDNSDEKLTEEINRLNGELAYKQKALLELRQKEEEERLRKEREQYLQENFCWFCQSEFTLENPSKDFKEKRVCAFHLKRASHYQAMEEKLKEVKYHENKLRIKAV